MDEIAQFIKYTSKISAILPIVVFLTSKSYTNKYINILTLLLFVAFVCDIASVIFAIHGQSNHVIANFYFILEFILIGFVYRQIFKDISRMYHMILMIIGVVFIAINLILGPNLTSIQSTIWAGSCLLMASMALGHFTYIMKHPVIRLRSFAPYWITIGLLFYCCSTFVILAFSDVLIRNLGARDFRAIWAVHNINNIIKNIFFLFAIFWAPRREAFLQVFNSGQN